MLAGRTKPLTDQPDPAVRAPGHTGPCDHVEIDCVVPSDLAGERFDRAAARLFTAISRSELASWIRAGQLTLDGRAVKASTFVAGGERMQGHIERPKRFDWETAEELAFEVVHQDTDVIVVDKPAGLVVHPGVGQPRGTLVNGLLHRFPDLAILPRAGLVHRLDKDTSGLMVVAANAESLLRLGQAMRETAHRTTLSGGGGRCTVDADRTIDAPIGRHPRQRTRQAVREDGRPAVTYVRVCERFAQHSLVEARLETGRTHQIRVHLAYIGRPLVGDGRYGADGRVPFGAAPDRAELVRAFPRQALHAHHLAFAHPRLGTRMRFDSPLPEDVSNLLTTLREAMP